MSVRREDAASKSDEVQTGSSWFPATPAKPGSSDLQPIRTDWGETERYGQASSSDAPACYTSMSLNNTSGGVKSWPAGMVANSHVYEENLINFESWVAANSHVYGRDSSTYDGFSINDSGQWANMSFGNLLRAMNKTAPVENALDSSSSCFGGSSVEDPLGGTGFSGASGMSTPYFHQSVGSSQFGRSSFDQGTVLGANFGAEMGMPSTIMDTSSIHDRHLLDLNAPPRTTSDAAFRTSIRHQFEPITPQKSNGGEYGQVSAMNNSSTDEAPTGEKSKIACNGEMQLHEKNEKSHLLNEQLCEVTSTQLQENHKPDKGGTEEADLLKTPQQKARRKKHRPKVIIEGKKKNNPKPSPQKNSGPPETPRVKRKYVRKNGVNSPLGGADNGSDTENKTPSFTETTVEKRKQGRSKGINKSEEMDKETTETTEIHARRYSLRSSRRSLNFNDDPVIDGVSRNCPFSPCERELQAENSNVEDQQETENCTRETEVMEEKDMVTSHVRTRSVNHIREDFPSRAERNPQSSLPPINKDTLKESDIITDQTVSTRVKCQIVFSDVTHDKEANTVQVSMNSEGQRTPKRISDSIGSDTCLTPEKKISVLKRQNTDTSVEAAPQPRNEAGIMYNSLQAYLSVFMQNADNGTPGLYFPTIYKKKRTEKVYSTVTSSMQITAHSNNGIKFEKHTIRNSCGSMFTAPTNQGFYGAQSVVNNLLTTNHATGGSQNGRQVFQDLLALGPTDRIKRKRSKGPTRKRSLAPLLKNSEQWPKPRGRPATISRSEQNIEFLSEPLTCIEALVADTRPTMATKKRSKRSMSINSTAQTLYDHQHFAGTSTGPPLALTWKTMSPVDSITEKLNRLDLNAKRSTLQEKYNYFMPYRSSFEERYALVPFQTSGPVVPFDQVRRRKPRPKVDLDDETTRVWRLLLENINSEGIDGTNEENTKWWEEERRVFNGRADSFIARMHLVQGDRHFSPWKGSVLDSVVGVFLTQNVSDHLSSSAFMSLAARFPARPNSGELHYERPGCEINEPDICELDSDGTFLLTKEILNEAVCSEDTTKLKEFEDDRIKEVNSMKPSQNASGDDSSLRSQSTDTSPSPVISCEIIANRSVGSEDGKDTEDTLSSQAPEISSQDSITSPILPATGKSDSCLLSTLEEEPTAGVKPNWLTSSTSFVKLLEMTDTVLNGTYREGNDKRKSDEGQYAPSKSLACSLQNEDHLDNPKVPGKAIASYGPSSLCRVPNLRAQSTEFDMLQKNSKFSDSSSNKEIYTAEISGLSSESASGLTFQKSTDISSRVQKLSSSIACSSINEQIEINQKKVDNQRGQAPPHNKMQGGSEIPNYQQNLMDATATGSSCNIDNSKEHKEVNSNKPDLDNHPQKTGNGPKSVGRGNSKEKENQVDWDQLRKQAQFGGRKRERTNRTLDSVDWEAIRCADVNEIAQTIKERGMNNMLAERIKDFLNRIVRDHGSIDLEWLRDVPPDKAKEYLLSVRGLGLKSVECVRLLTLHHLAFPVDTNVGRIAVRLGWVPLQPLPESLQLHLLELYPVLESIQKYLWPRLCKLDQKTLYELHYQMITFGKVFCTKSRPNCNACPMRGECRHFASAYASARLSLPAPQDKSIVTATGDRKAGQNPIKRMETLQLSFAQTDNRMNPKSGVSNYLPIIEEPKTPEPIIEVPATPEPDYAQASECDIESAFGEDPDEIPTIHLNMEEFTHNLQTIMQQNTELQEGEMSKALVALTSEAASIPVPKLKNVSRLRTEHHVYELPDSHPLLDGLDKREPDDPCPYLLAIWTPGETMDSIEPPEKRCSSQGLDKLCTDETCLSCNSIREAKSQTVRGTLLIPCRTAMRGSFPLNGTYFQVNEVFSDHESSLCPMDIPRKFLWNLPRRTVYFGTSIPSIFKGFSTEGIQYCFWRGFVCVRGFDRKTRAPRPLIARLHFPASKLAKGKGKVDEN